MEPVIALVGRPNVGKSTLFNCLTRTRDALVADYPGLTRDRQYGRGVVGERPYVVIDTGGMGEDEDGIHRGMRDQTLQALAEADAALLLVDARSGPTAADQELAATLRRLDKPVWLVMNKIDGLDPWAAAAEFHSIGLGSPIPIAAVHGRGVSRLLDQVLAALPADGGERPDAADSDREPDTGIGVAVVGRPNVGKSTLVNRLLGEERVLVYDRPGTTRDSVFVPFEHDGTAYTLIDTAGVRRRGRVRQVVEKFSIVKTLQAIEAANVVILVLDASEQVTEQDAHLIGHVLDAGRALVIAVNKWDGLEPAQKARTRRTLERKLAFADFARVLFVSALHGSGTGLLFDAVRRAYAAAHRDLDTPKLNAVLAAAIAAHPPPLVRGRRIKLRYAHQGGRNPPVIVIHGNQTGRLPVAYRRYLEHKFRRELDLWGTPVRLELKTTDNPYADRVNRPTRRQQARHQRLQEHARARKARPKRR